MKTKKANAKDLVNFWYKCVNVCAQVNCAVIALNPLDYIYSTNVPVSVSGDGSSCNFLGAVSSLKNLRLPFTQAQTQSSSNDKAMLSAHETYECKQRHIIENTNTHTYMLTHAHTFKQVWHHGWFICVAAMLEDLKTSSD